MKMKAISAIVSLGSAAGFTVGCEKFFRGLSRRIANMVKMVTRLFARQLDAEWSKKVAGAWEQNSNSMVSIGDNKVLEV